MLETDWQSYGDNQKMQIYLLIIRYHIEHGETEEAIKAIDDTLIELVEACGEQVTFEPA